MSKKEQKKKSLQAGAELSKAQPRWAKKLQTEQDNCHCMIGLSSSLISTLGKEALFEYNCLLDLNMFE